MRLSCTDRRYPCLARLRRLLRCSGIRTGELLAAGEVHNIADFQSAGLVYILALRYSGFLGILRNAIASDVSAVHLQISPSAGIVDIALNHRNGTSGNLLNNTDMIRTSGIVSDTAVLPVIEDIISRRRNVGIILLPRPHLLEQLNHLIASALSRNDVRQFGNDCRSGCTSGTPRIGILHCIASRQRLMCIVNVDNLLMAAVALLAADPPLHNSNYFLS